MARLDRAIDKLGDTPEEQTNKVVRAITSVLSFLSYGALVLAAERLDGWAVLVVVIFAGSFIHLDGYVDGRNKGDW